MQYKVVMDPACAEPEIVIRTAQMTAEVQEIVDLLQKPTARVLQGYQGEEISFLPQTKIVRIYSQNQKVFAQTKDSVYQLRLRLYEAERKLDPEIFIRISNAEIINSKCIQKLDVSLSGTIGVYLDGEIKTFASRRYVARIKEFFHIRKEKRG